MTAPAGSPQPLIFIDIDETLADMLAYARAQGNRDHDWWANIPAFEGAKEFYDAAEKLGTVNLLAAPAHDEESFSGKAVWVEKFSPEKSPISLLDLMVCDAGDRHYLATHGRILVDANEQNIREWIADGGIGIHHKGDYKDTLQALAKAVETLAIQPEPEEPAFDDELRIFLDIDGTLTIHSIIGPEMKTPEGRVRWEDFSYEWWAEYPSAPGAKEFYDAINRLAPSDFLTAPGFSGDCFAGKAAWVQKFVPEDGKLALKNLMICFGGNKRLFARPTHILVDDNELTVRNWIDDGGIAIHHKGDYAQTLKAVELAVEKLKITAKAKSKPVPKTAPASAPAKKSNPSL